MSDQTRIRTTRKRTARLAGVLGIGLMLAALVPGPAQSADEEFVTGSGQSYAQLYRVGPTAGRLSLAPILGLSLADYLNTVGRGETKLADWAGIGVAEPSLPDNTPALKTSSTKEGSEKGETEVVMGQSGEPGGGFFEMYVRATKAPLGESRFRTSSINVPGLIEARDAQSHTTSGVISTAKGKVRQSTASADMGTVDIAGGTVKLKGLRWEAIQRTGAVKTAAGSFTVDGVSIGGAPLPMPGSPSDLAAVLDPINAALAPTGFAISLPAVEKRGGGVGVTPLSLDIVNSPLGRQYLAPILAELHPARQPVTDQFIDLAKELNKESDLDGDKEGEIPDLTVGVLAADLTLGIFSGSSQLHIELGGVRSFTEGQRFESPFGDFNPPEIPAGEPAQTIFQPGTPGRPATPGTVRTDEGTLVAAGPPGQRTVPGDRGGVAVAVGLIGLAVAIGLALADWYRMRTSRQAAASA